MFDLPSVSSKEIKAAQRWHKFLIRTGFIMMTESVYSRLAINKSISTSIKRLVNENLPPRGNIQLLEITEKQYASMEYLLGDIKTNVVNTTERYVEL